MLEQVLLFEKPYRYFIAFDCFDTQVVAHACSVLQGPVLWEERHGHFFFTYRLDLGRFFERRPDAPSFVAAGFLDRMRLRMAEIFAAPLSLTTQVLGHRMVAGQEIGVHNDNPGLGYEGYRLVVQFTKDHSIDDGGELRVHVGDKPDSIYQTIRPCINMGFGFETSAQSYHSVSRVIHHSRDALIFNFWHIGNDPEVERLIFDTLNGIDPERHRTSTRLQRVGDFHSTTDDMGASAAHCAKWAATLLNSWECTDPIVHASTRAAALLIGEQPEKASLDGILPPACLIPNTLPAATHEHFMSLLRCHPALRIDPDVAVALSSLAVWIARAEKRMFSHTQWKRMAGLINPHVERLPLNAAKLCFRLFGPEDVGAPSQSRPCGSE